MDILVYQRVILATVTMANDDGYPPVIKDIQGEIPQLNGIRNFDPGDSSTH